MNTTVTKLANNISKLTTEEIDELNTVLINMGIASNIYKYSNGIINNSQSTAYNVYLTSAGDKKILMVKTLKELFGIGLREAKDIIDSIPCLLAEDVSIDIAEAYKNDIESIGGKIEIK